ncbi:PAS domain S-box-containing protein [Deinococcus sp. HSC-46F16]|uniref:PAS domain S-box protein n=1 Tax=Deinococcus sp. HSC-46F16 TaxID=2910968 RepID=UPI0020A18579|nr:PAS domain S-box protein [Deinococcus sp. HSC-46F16]MCP2014552.1 PAS domain S-box-containing protein [Deinococcus sp. HSC-46F16]
MPVRPDSSAAPFDVLVLLCPAEGVGALSAVFAALPAHRPAVLLVPPPGGAVLRLDEWSRHLPLPVRRADQGTLLQPGGVYLAPPHAVLEVRPGGRCAVTPPQGDLAAERPLDRLLASLAVSFGERTLAVLPTDRGGAAGARALRGVGGTVLELDPAERPNAGGRVGGAGHALAPGDLGHAVAGLLAGRPLSRFQPQGRGTGLEELCGPLFTSLDEGVCLFERLPPRPDGRRDYRYLAMNPAMQAMFGVPDLSGQSIRDTFPDEAEAWYDDYDRVLETGAPLRVERESAPQGKVLDMFVTRVEGGPGPRLLAVMRDVTGRKQAEAALRESEDRLARALDAGEIGAWELDLLTLDAWRSPQHDRIFGYATLLPEWTYEMFLDHVFPEDRDWVDARFQEAIARAGRWDFECRIHRADGEVRWIMAQGRVDPGEAGGPGRMKGTVRDITAHKQAEAALRTNEEKYRALFTEMDEAYAVVEVMADAAGRWADFLFLDVNPAFLRHTGMPYPVGRTATELLGRPNPRWAELYGRAVETGEAIRVEEHELTLGRVFDLNIFRLGGEGSRRVAVLFTDITERKRREANQELLMEISRDLSQPSSEEELVHTVGAKLAAHLGLTCYHYVDVDEDRAEVTVRHFWHALDVPTVLGTYPIDGFMSQGGLSNLRAGKTSVINDAQNDLSGDTAATAELRAGAAAQKIGAYVAVPYSQDGRWRAYLAVADSRARPWTEPETRLVQEVASRLFPRIERARAEEARRSSEEKYRTLFDAMAEGFAVCGVMRDAAGHVVDLRCLELNRALEQQTGLDRRAVLGRRLSEVLPKTDLERWLSIYTGVIDSGEPVTFEEYTELLGRWFAVSVYPRAGDELSIFYHDVTGRKRAEEILRASEERQAFLLALSDRLRTEVDARAIALTSVSLLADHLHLDRAYVAQVNKDRDLAEIGPEYRRPDLAPVEGVLTLSDFPEAFAQVERATLVLGDTATDPALSELDRRGFAALRMGALMVASARKGTRNPVWALLVATEKPRRWTAAEVALVEEVAERTWAAVERTRTEEARRASEARFRAVANLVPDLLWESQPDGFTSWYNQRWLEYTGQTSEQASGWGWADAIHPEDRELSAQRYRQATQAGQALRQEHRIRRHDGEYCWFVVNIFPVRDERGQVVRIYGAATDIHDLRALNTDLEARVAERTRRLADLNAELGNVITRTAHNLEAPARRLGQALDPGRPFGPEALDTLSSYDPSALRDEVTRLRGIAQDLRQLAQLEQRGVTKELLPLGELFEEVRAEASTTPRGAQVQWLIDPLPIVRADRALLRQALEVLTTFTLSETRGARYVTVGSQEVEGEVQIMVEDDGLGLTGEEAATLFDLAVRTDQSVPLLEGSGLSQVRRILARHGGWAWAEALRTRGKVVLAFPRDELVNKLEALFRQDNPGP